MAPKKSIKTFKPCPESANLNDDLLRLSEILDESTPGQGKALVVKIAKEFPGSYIYLPQQGHMFRKQRDQWIIEQYDAGYKVPKIARAASLSEKQVWTILGRTPK